MLIASFLPILIIIIIFLIVFKVVSSIIFPGFQKKMIGIIEKQVSDFKKNNFTSEEERIKAKETLIRELDSWKTNLELARGNVSLRNKTMPILQGSKLTSKNLAMIDNILSRIETELHTLN